MQKRRKSRTRLVARQKQDALAGLSTIDRILSLAASALGEPAPIITDHPDLAHAAPGEYKRRETGKT